MTAGLQPSHDPGQTPARGDAGTKPVTPTPYQAMRALLLSLHNLRPHPPSAPDQLRHYDTNYMTQSMSGHLLESTLYDL